MVRTQGTSLLEIILTLCILSFSLLALAQLHHAAISLHEKNFFGTIAVRQIYAMADRIAVNPQQIDCEKALWNQENALLMPEGKGVISGHNPYNITISWYDKMHMKEISMGRKITL